MTHSWLTILHPLATRRGTFEDPKSRQFEDFRIGNINGAEVLRAKVIEFKGPRVLQS